MLGSKKVWWVVLWGVVYLGPSFAYSQTTSVIQLSNDELKPRRPFDFRGQYSFDVGLAEYTEGKDDTATAYIFLHAEFDFKFLKNLKGKLHPNGRFYSGRSQERYDTDDLANRLYFRDFYVSYEPFKFLEFRAGGHSQSFLKTKMLISNYRTFPGLQEIVKTDIGRSWSGSLVAQQLVPTSHSINDERSEAEPRPGFYTYHASIEGTVPGWMELEALGGYYKWSDIPSKVVYESRLVGNVGLGEVVPGSKFAYEHKGWFGSGAACLCLGLPVDLIAEYSRIHNTAAPGDSADAQLWGIGPRINLPSHQIDIRYRSYFIESDATVAAYGRSKFGNTNRIGENLEINLKFKDRGFALYAEAYRNRPLNIDPYQRDMEIYYLGLETDDVSF